MYLRSSVKQRRLQLSPRGPDYGFAPSLAVQSLIPKRKSVLSMGVKGAATLRRTGGCPKGGFWMLGIYYCYL